MRTLVILCLAFFAFNCNSTSKPIEGEEKLVGISEEILKNLDEGDFDNVRSDFNTKMKEVLSSESIKTVWDGLEAQIGEYQSKGEVITDTLQGYRVVYIICKFAQSPFKLKVVFDESNLVAGLFLIPVNQK